MDVLEEPLRPRTKVYAKPRSRKVLDLALQDGSSIQVCPQKPLQALPDLVAGCFKLTFCGLAAAAHRLPRPLAGRPLAACVALCVLPRL